MMKKYLPLILIIFIGIVGNYLLLKKSDRDVGADTTSTDPSAVSTVYQNGVPHTDKNGKITLIYDPNTSLFPIGIYHPHTDLDLNTISNNTTGFNLAILGLDYVTHNVSSVSGVLGKIQNSSNPNFKLLLINKGTDFFKSATENPENPMNQLAGLPAYPYDSAILDSFSFLKNVQEIDTKNTILGFYTVDEALPRLRLDGNDTAQCDNWIGFLNVLISNLKLELTKPLFHVNSASITAANRCWYKFAAVGDIAVMDNYPTLAKEPLATSKTSIPRTVLATTKENNEQKPVWLIVQSYRPINGRFPTVDEEKAYVYSGIINGATGIIYYDYDNPANRSSIDGVVGISPNPDPSLSEKDQNDSKNLWNAIAGSNGINSQINQLSPVILSKTSRVNYSISYQGANTSASPIQTILKEYDGKYYLIAVNVETTTMNATFNFQSEVVNSKSVNVDFENRSIQGTSRSFNDVFAPLGVHVYSWGTENPIASPTESPIENQTCLSAGFNVVNSASAVSPSTIAQNGNIIFDFNQTGVKSWRKSTNEDIPLIKPGIGYYVYSFGDNCYATPAGVTASSNDTPEIRRGWNLLANGTDKILNLTGMTYQTIKQLDSNTQKPPSNDCASSNCFENTKLSDLFTLTNSKSRAYKYIYLIQDSKTVDPTKAYQIIKITPENINSISVPAHTLFWFYLFE